MDIFSTKYGHESSVFLENERFFFENIWALEQFFFVKYPKKGHPIHFFGHNV